MSINDIREFINLRLYSHKGQVFWILRMLTILVSLSAFGSLIYYHGFNPNLEQQKVANLILEISFGFYFLRYLIKFIYHFQPKMYLRDTRVEGVLLGIVVVNFLSIHLFGFHLLYWLSDTIQIHAFKDFLDLFIQAYFLLFVALEAGKVSGFLPVLKLSPPTLLIYSFVVLILSGAGLLMLPAMNNQGVFTSFSDALFTSISASCVTGLVVVDTATYFSFKGQLVIMGLIQLGGLNIISFASVFALLAGKGFGIRHTSILRDSLSYETLEQTQGLFRRIFTFTLLIEGLSTALLFFSWGDGVQFTHLGQRLYYSMFHAISAFNNAGFSLFTEGLYQDVVRQSFTVHFFIALTVIFGGLGFPALYDALGVKFMRERIRKPWVHFKVGTKIVVYATVILLLFGTSMFWLLERNGVLAGMNGFEQFMHSFFQSVTTRTAGFNTVDIGALGSPILMVFIFLMFIGASPGSTGGGIKTTTFMTILLSVWSTMHRKERLEIFKTTIPYELLNKAFSILVFSLTFVFVGTVALLVTDPQFGLMQSAFEVVSAFCTVGLSTGITAELSEAGRVVIMASMFIGRIGTLTLAYSLGMKKVSNDYKYPKASMMVG